jgi:uncharacterized membrane protein YadS
MSHTGLRILLLSIMTLGARTAHAAVDSYRFMHVTIETPWYIFLFLLIMIFIPFILMAVLAWVSAARKADSESGEADRNTPKE